MMSRAFRIQWSGPRAEKPRVFFLVSLVFIFLCLLLLQSFFLVSFVFFIILRASYIFTPRYYNCVRISFNVPCTFLISIHLKALICLEYNLLIVVVNLVVVKHKYWCYVYFIFYKLVYFYILIYIFKTLIYIFEIIYKQLKRCN